MEYNVICIDFFLNFYLCNYFGICVWFYFSIQVFFIFFFQSLDDSVI
jgi:hypothetical protein